MNDDIQYEQTDTEAADRTEGDETAESVEKFKKLKEDLKACRAEKEEYLAGWQRSRADFINARKEEEERRSEFARLREEKILRDLLEVADSFEAARRFDSSGNEQIQKQFFDTLKRHGVSPIDTGVGKKFDPLYHEAIGQTETDRADEDETVVEELQKGYQVNGRVLRPSKVKVALFKNQS